MPKVIKMPPGSPQYLKNLPNNLRVEPYPKSKPTKPISKPSNADKENADAIAKPKSRVKGSSKADSKNTEPNPNPKARVPKPKKVPEAQQQYNDWWEIELEEVYSEVCCYDNAAAVRRKLKKLLSDKNLIPCSDGKKTWTQVSINAEMQLLEAKHGPVEYKHNRGPTVGSLAGFLKKTGNMGGGDSPAYYWGYVLCEKLRIWNGEKKTKGREEAEVDGLVRVEPDRCYDLAKLQCENLKDDLMTRGELEASAKRGNMMEDIGNSRLFVRHNQWLYVPLSLTDAAYYFVYNE
ncbi:MAG: hypothetical protein Q9195_003993 [Heterodermia aff. obscurata]